MHSRASNRHGHRLLLALLLTLGIVGAATVAPGSFGGLGSAAAAAKPLTSNYPTAVAGETIVFTGALPMRVARPVRLQIKSGTSWRTLTTKKTTAAGAYRFATRVVRTSTYRVLAPRATVNGKVWAMRATAGRRIVVVKQSARAAVLPRIAHYGTVPEASSKARTVVAARFTPIRPGRLVYLERKSGTSWQVVAQARQNSQGNVSLKTLAVPGAGWRARAVASRGAPAVAVGLTSRTWTSLAGSSEFSGTELQHPWDYRLLNTYPGGLRGCARSTSDMVNVSGGVLALSAKRDAFRQDGKSATECPDGTYRNGHVGTGEGRFSFTYGVAAARVKFQPKTGQHGAFWIQSSISGVGAEIDVAEYFGAGRPDFGLTQFIHYANSNGSHTTYGSIANKAYQQRTREALASRTDDWWKAYHVFSVEWTPSGYVFRIDGLETFRTAGGKSSNPGVLILSLLTSDWEATVNDGTKQTVYVDWVKVWR